MFGWSYATFNNISVISWRSVLLVEETGGPGENLRPASSHWQILSHNVVHLAMIGRRTHNSSGDGHRLHRYSCKSNYHTSTATTVPRTVWRCQRCKKRNLKSTVLGLSGFICNFLTRFPYQMIFMSLTWIGSRHVPLLEQELHIPPHMKLMKLALNSINHKPKWFF
jgi:hypothetical protein